MYNCRKNASAEAEVDSAVTETPSVNDNRSAKPTLIFATFLILNNLHLTLSHAQTLAQLNYKYKILFKYTDRLHSVSLTSAEEKCDATFYLPYLRNLFSNLFDVYFLTF